MKVFTLSYFWKDMFSIENLDPTSPLTVLPFIITAVCLGVILASVLYTLWRYAFSKFLGGLIKQDAVGCEKAVSLADLGYTKKSVLVRLLLSPTSVLYKFVSSPLLDQQNEAISSALENGENVGKVVKNLAPRRLPVDESTTFYIPEDKAEYAKGKGGTFKVDDIMNLVYVVLACIGIWFMLLNFLDPLVALLGD